MAEHVTTTPCGWRLEFEDGEPDPLTDKSKRRSYTVEGETYPSVTTILGILDKPGIPYAAEKLTVKAAIDLAREGELPMSVDGALSRMKARELRFYQVWQGKAKSGTLAHEDLVALGTGAELRDLDEYLPAEQGFIRGVSDWYADCHPTTLDTETPVASLEHGFAGRYDLRARFLHDSRKAIEAQVVGLTGRVDLKTTEALPRWKDGTVKPPYPEMILQLAGYELAAVECGHAASDFQAVLRVDSTGAYDFTTSWLIPDDFLPILHAYRGVALAKRPPKAVAT